MWSVVLKLGNGTAHTSKSYYLGAKSSVRCGRASLLVDNYKWDARSWQRKIFASYKRRDSVSSLDPQSCSGKAHRMKEVTSSHGASVHSVVFLSWVSQWFSSIESKVLRFISQFLLHIPWNPYSLSSPFLPSKVLPSFYLLMLCTFFHNRSWWSVSLTKSIRVTFSCITGKSSSASTTRDLENGRWEEAFIFVFLLLLFYLHDK